MITKNKFDWVAILIILGILVSILYLFWTSLVYGRDFAFSQAPFVVAVVVGLVAIFSLKLTRDSLELTRATIRPFVNVLGNVSIHTYSKSIGDTIQVRSVINSGVFPADEIRCSCRVLLDTHRDGMQFSADEALPSVLFPNQTLDIKFKRNAKDTAELCIDKGGTILVEISITYRNKLTNDELLTFRQYKMDFEGRDSDNDLTLVPRGDKWV